MKGRGLGVVMNKPSVVFVSAGAFMLALAGALLAMNFGGAAMALAALGGASTTAAIVMARIYMRDGSKKVTLNRALWEEIDAFLAPVLLAAGIVLYLVNGESWLVGFGIVLVIGSSLFEVYKTRTQTGQ